MHGEDAQATGPGARPVTVRDAAEQHRDRTAVVGDDEPAGRRRSGARSPSPSRSPAAAGRIPSGPPRRSASSAHSGTPVSSAPTSRASSTRPRGSQPAVHEALDDHRLDRRAVDVGVEPDVAGERAVGGRHGLAAHRHRPRAPTSGRRGRAGARGRRPGCARRPARARRPRRARARAARARPPRRPSRRGRSRRSPRGRPPARGARLALERGDPAVEARAGRSRRCWSPVTRPPGSAYVSCGQTATP